MVMLVIEIYSLLRQISKRLKILKINQSNIFLGNTDLLVCLTF